MSVPDEQANSESTPPPRDRGVDVRGGAFPFQMPGGRRVGLATEGRLLAWRRAAQRGAGMALCSCSGMPDVCSGTGVQGDGRVCAICGGSGQAHAG